MKVRFKKLLFIAILIFSKCFAISPENVKIVKHSTDLEKMDIPLDCKWEYFDRQLIEPSYFLTNDYLFNEDLVVGKLVELPYFLESENSYATYHCRIENLNPTLEYAMLTYRFIIGDCDIFVNGENIYSTRSVSTEKRNFNEHVQRNTRPVSFTSNKYGTADIVIYVSNYEFLRGGLTALPRISSELYVNNFLFKNLGFKGLVAGIFLVLFLYYLILFFMSRRKQVYFFIALLNLDLLFITCAFDFSLISFFVTEFSYKAHYRMIFFSFMLLIPIYNIYMVTLYDLKSKLNVGLITADCIFAILVLFLPIYNIDFYMNFIVADLLFNSIFLCVLVLINRNRIKAYYINILIIAMLATISIHALMFGWIDGHGEAGAYGFRITLILVALIQSVLSRVERDRITFDEMKRIKQFERNNIMYRKFVPFKVLDYLQLENVGEVKPGDNFINEGMLIVGLVNSEVNKKLPDEELFLIIEKFFTKVLEVVRRYDGFFLKTNSRQFTIAFTEKTEKCVKCAVEIQKMLNEVNFEQDNVVKVRMDMAIHSVRIAIGIVGNENQLMATGCSSEIGEVSEICALNQMLGSRILITENGLQYCRNYSDALFEGVVVEIKGAKTLVYKVIPFDNSFEEDLEEVDE